MAPTIKQGIILALAKHGTVKRARHLIPDVGHDEHNITHVLYALSKQGFVAYREHKKGTVQELTKIRLTPRGEREAEELRR